MKRMKKLLSSLLAVMLMAAMLTVPASAEGTYTITITDSVEENRYAAYQIFAGDLKLDSTNGNTVLSTIQWADASEGSSILAALKDFTDTTGNKPFTSVTTAQGVADVLDNWSYNESDIKNFADTVAAVVAAEGTTPDGRSEFASNEHTISGLSAGYYLILTETAASGSGYTDYLLKVTNNVEIAPKVSLPALTKTVGNTLDGTYTNGADFQVGVSESAAGSNVVYFKLEGTLPSEYESYKQYYYRMEDTINTNIYKLESGATHPVQEIYRLHANGSKTPVDSSKIDAYTTWDEATGNLVIDFGNLKDHPHALNPNDRIVVKLKFSLVGSPVVGKGNDDGMGNVNTATLFYSNDPNQADVELDEGENYVDKIKMGSTSDDASVYTYGIELKKVAAANTSTALPGAEFVLSRKITSSSSGTETTTIYYAIVEQDANVTDKNVYKVKQWVADKNNSNLTMTTGEDGTFTVTGLDGVQYHLTETKAPAGYNKLTEDVLVNIQATINATSGVLTELKGTADSKNATGDTTTGILSFNIVNNGGATLPETGGMGTTIFYIAGGALMIGAAAVLIAKKRETEK